MKNAEEFFREQCPLHTPAEIKMFADFAEQYASLREKETAIEFAEHIVSDKLEDAFSEFYNYDEMFNDWYTKHKEG